MEPYGTVEEDPSVPLAKSSASSGFGSAVFVAVIRNLAVPRANSQFAGTVKKFLRHLDRSVLPATTGIRPPSPELCDDPSQRWKIRDDRGFVTICVTTPQLLGKRVQL